MIDWKSIDEEWFRENGFVDPVLASQQWMIWSAENPDASEKDRQRRVLELASGTKYQSVYDYLTGRKRVGSRNAAVLASIDRAMGFNLDPVGWPERRQSPRYIALLTELHVPSPQFHWEILSVLSRETAHRKLSVHPVFAESSRDHR